MKKKRRKTKLANIANTKAPKDFLGTENLSDLLNETKTEINALIEEIKSKVVSVEPLSLLKYFHTMFCFLSLNITSELKLPFDDGVSLRMTEYVQSILVSVKSEHTSVADNDLSLFYAELQAQIEDLYYKIYAYYFYFFTINKRDDIYEELEMIEAQLDFHVRGNRYPIFEKQYLMYLLKNHNDEFQKLFGIGFQEIVNGITKIEYSITKGYVDIFKRMGEIIDTCEEINISPEDFRRKYPQDSIYMSEMLAGYALYDVKKITNWPTLLIDVLSYELGECPSFFDGNDYSGWPIKDFPVQRKPFIKVNNVSYCFDYYNFADNIYRAIQKAVTKLDKQYLWKDHQQEASETAVKQIFEKLLPGCETHIGNYYPINGSKRDFAENDLLIIYDNVVLIVEVKAGSFVFTSPILDFENHIKSYKSLVEKADHQCHRTYEYLENDGLCSFYDKNKEKIFDINMRKISDIFTLSITVDNINTLATKAEKLSFLSLKSKAISIALDDLMVYQDFFSSPLCFLHFLYQRREATKNINLSLNDELDHLGLYNSNNFYSNITEDFKKKNTHIHFVGYRDDLDSYYCAINNNLEFSKPEQRIPQLILQIIHYLEQNSIPGRVSKAKYLLDFNGESREQFCSQVYAAANRQKENHSEVIVHSCSTNDNAKYSCYINQESKSFYEKREYILAIMVRNNESEHTLIDIVLDNYNNLKSFDLWKFTTDDVDPNEKEQLFFKGEQIIQRRMNKYFLTHKRKIGRNELCPCGSGKKYKKCCGR